MKTGYKSSPIGAVKGYESPDMPTTFSLDASDLKDIKSWKVGQTYDLEMTVKMVGLREDSLDKMPRATFEIVDVQPDDDSDEED